MRAHLHYDNNRIKKADRKFLVEISENHLIKPTIFKVLIYPRIDCCFHEYIDMTVHIGQHRCLPKVSLDKSSIISHVNEFKPVEFICPDHTQGSQVKVQTTKYNNMIAEIEVVGKDCVPIY